MGSESEQQSKQYSEAKERVEQRLGFYIHLAVFVVVNAGLTILDLNSSPEKLWFFWPLGGWGIGLAFHAAKVFGSNGSSLKEKMIQQEMARR